MNKHSAQSTLREVILTVNLEGIAFIIDQDRLIGVITGGDIRRALLEGKNLDTAAQEIMNRGFVSCGVGASKKELESACMTLGPGVVLPILDKNSKIVDTYIAKNYPKINIMDKNLYCSPEESIREVIHKIDLSGQGVCIVQENGIKGIVTDKDIRTSILNGKSIDDGISSVMNKEPFVIEYGTPREMILKMLKESTIRGNIKIPVLKEGRVVDLVQVEEFDGELLFHDQKPKTVLVTGGAGYLGSILIRKLLKKGYYVRVLDNLMYGNIPIKGLMHMPNFSLVEGDVRHIETVVAAAKGADAVVHLAGLVGDPACAVSPQTTIEQNYLSTVALAHVCKYNQINRFIFASSCSVYGHGNQILTEESKLSPVSLYAQDKINSEKAILQLTDDNFSPTIMRMGTLYGWSHRLRFDLVVNILTAMAVKKGEFSVFGGDQWRPLLHVDDAAEAYVLALEAPIPIVKGQIFNVGSNKENYKIIQIGEIVKSIVGARMVVAGADIDKRDYRVNFDKINKSLAFSPRYSVKDGVKEIMQSLKEGLVDDFTLPKYSNYKFLVAE